MARARALAHAYVDFAWQNKHLYRLVRTEQWGSRHVEELNFENWDLGRATVAELQLEGVLRRSPIEEQLAIMWTACHGVASLALDRFRLRRIRHAFSTWFSTHCSPASGRTSSCHRPGLGRALSVRSPFVRIRLNYNLNKVSSTL